MLPFSVSIAWCIGLVFAFTCLFIDEKSMCSCVFMAAAMKQMNALVEEEYIADDEVVQLLENEVVLITAADADLGMKEFTDILKANTIAIGDPESVPVGQYAQDSFTNLGIWEDVLAKASLGTNVTEVLSLDIRLMAISRLRKKWTTMRLSIAR